MDAEPGFELFGVPMSFTESIFLIWDRVCNILTWTLIDKKKVNRSVENERAHSGINDNIAYYWDAFHTIHSRASALLSHLSIMIAISMFALSVAPHGIPNYLMSLEVGLYILMTIYTARALKSLSLEANYKEKLDYEAAIKDEICHKYALIQVSLALTILITVMLFIFLVYAFVVPHET